MDIIGIRDHVDLLMKAVQAHRYGAADHRISEDVIPGVKTLTEESGIDLTISHQVHRPNTGGSIEEYHRRAIYVPYMDLLIQFLGKCFSESSMPYFHIFTRYPRGMLQKKILKALCFFDVEKSSKIIERKTFCRF